MAFYNRAPDGIDRAPDRINSLFTKHFSRKNLRDSLKLHVQRLNSYSYRSSFSLGTICRYIHRVNQTLRLSKLF